MPTGLQRRGARYYIRRRIPLDVLHHYDGQTEIVRALRTADPKVARKLLPLRWAELEREFDAYRAASPLEPRSGHPAQTPKRPAKQVIPYATMSEAAWEHMIEGNELQGAEAFREEVEREQREEIERSMLALASGPTEGLTPEQLAMRDLLRDAAHSREVAQERAAFAQRELKQAQQAVRTAGPAGGASRNARSETSGTSMDTIVDKWAAERKVSAKGVDAHRAVARWFGERVGELAVEKVTKRDVLAFKDKLLAEGASAANVKVKLTRLRTLLNYAASNDFIPENPAKDVTVVVPDAEKNRRKPFDTQSLTKIFGSPVYTQDERPTGGRGEAAYWLPLLALYTGARLEELGQLRPSDVREQAYPDADENEQTAWFIHLTEDEADGLKLKNAGSERVVPVHPALEQQGFLRFVQAAKDAHQARLFPALRPNKYGRLTAKWGEWFGDYKRNVCGISDGRMVFHSFRHTFKRYARHVKMVEGVQRQLMGHSGRDAADDYGDGYTLHQLVEGMRQYKVPGFKPPPLPVSLR
jgi:integrase